MPSCSHRFRQAVFRSPLWFASNAASNLVRRKRARFSSGDATTRRSDATGVAFGLPTCMVKTADVNRSWHYPSTQRAPKFRSSPLLPVNGSLATSV